MNPDVEDDGDDSEKQEEVNDQHDVKIPNEDNSRIRSRSIEDDVVESELKKRRIQALRISRSSLSACTYYDCKGCYTDVNKMISMFECEDHNCCNVFDKAQSHDVSNTLNALVHPEMKHPHDDDEDWWM